MNKHFPTLGLRTIESFIVSATPSGFFGFLLLIPSLVSAQAPNFVWANRAGGIGSDGCRGLAVDRNGNSYVTGWFSGTATFGGTVINAVGTTDIYVAKYNSSGNVLWVSHVGGGTYNEGESFYTVLP